MRISDVKTGAAAGGIRGARGRSAGAVFSIDDGPVAARTERAAPPRSVAPLDALLAVQAEEAAQERKRRGVRRGRALIAALDALKIAMLVGKIGPDALVRLTSALADDTSSGDGQLDEILAAIDLRAAVELAKLAPAIRK